MADVSHRIGVLTAAVTLVVPGAGSAAALVDAITGLAEAGSEQLSRIEGMVTANHHRAWNEGIDKIEQSLRFPSERPNLLEEATGKFDSAHAGYAGEPDLAMWASAAAALTEYFRGRPEKAHFYIERAHAEGVGVVERQCQLADSLAIAGKQVPTGRLTQLRVILSIVGFSAVAAPLAIWVFPVLLGAGVGLFGFGIAVWLIVGVSGAAGEAAENALDEGVAKRFEKAAAATRKLAEQVTRIEEIAESMDLGRDALPRYELRVVKGATGSPRELKYLEVTSAA